MIKQRYEEILVDGNWYVFDHRNPESAPTKVRDQRDAEISADLWNIIEGYQRAKREKRA